MTDNEIIKATDNEIIKALECCNKSDNGKGCWECPYRQYCPDCLRRRNEDTIDLINRQKAEIERLTHNLEAIAQSFPNCAKAERTEAVKEFAERLKEKAHRCDLSTDEHEYYSVGVFEIDNLVKERVKEN